MIVYKYRYVDKEGMVLRGKVSAKNKNEALAQLEDIHELQLFKECGYAFDLPLWLRKVLRKDKPPLTDLARFFDQLAYMLRAGNSVSNSLRLQKSTSTGLMRKLIVQINEGIALGKTFSQAYVDCKEIGYPIYYKYILAGEQSGNLPDILNKLAIQIRQEISLKSKIKRALAYPVVLLVLTIGVAIFMFTSIIPQVTTVLEELSNGELPFITQVIQSIGNFFVQYGIYISLALIVFVALVVYIVKKKYMYEWHYFVLNLPKLGEIFRYTQFINFYQNLGYMLNAGFPTTEAFRVSYEAVMNEYLTRQLGYVYEELEKGKELPQALSTVEIIQPVELQTIRVGIATQNVQELLDKLTSSMQQEVDNLIESFVESIQPMAMGIVIGFLGLISAAVYFPLFELMKI